MSSILSYLYKMYKLLLIESYAQEMKLEEMSLKPKELFLRKPPDGACVFCGSFGGLSNLHTQGNHAQESTHENYSLVLLSCFHIKLIDPGGTGRLCEACVSRLKDAASFRAQVEAAEELLVEEEPPEQQPTIEDNPTLVKKEMKLSDDDNSDTFWNHYSASSDEEDLNQNLQELRDCKSLGWTDRELLKNNLERNEGVKRVEWKDQRQYPKPSTFRLPILEPNSTECPVCNQVFPKQHELQLHFEYHFPRFLCELCGKIFAKRMTYRSHLQSHQAGGFPCPQCKKKTYANKNSLMQHVKMAHDNKMLYSCPKCNVRFTNGVNRKEHLLKEHGMAVNMYPCPECSLKGRSPCQLDKHVRKVHRKEKNVSCPECGAFFFSDKELNRHSSSHSDIRNFICDLCGKAFKNRKHLRTHLDIHYDNRRFRCLLCKQTFVQNSSLLWHMKSHHKTIAHRKTVRKDDSAAFSICQE